MKDCIAFGLSNHRSIRVYENEKRASEQKAREALADYLPKIEATGGLADNIKPQVSIIPAGLFGPTDTKVAFTKRYNTTAQVELNQTIYDQAAITGLQASKYNKKNADVNIQHNEESIIYNISNAYQQVHIYQLQLQLLHANEYTYSEQLKIANLGVDKGVTAEVDRNKIQVNYNNTLSQINVAEKNLSLASTQLKNEMGYALNDVLTIDTLASAEVIPVLNAQTADTFRVQNRTDYQASEIEAALLDISARQKNGSKLPTLSFYARYGANGFGDKLGQSFSSFNALSVIGLNLKIPLFNGFKKNAQYAQARIEYQNAQENMKIDADKYRVEYENAKTTLLKAAVNVQNDYRNIELAKSVFKSTDLQYQKGVTDLTDWLNSQNSLREAQNNFLNSLYSFYTAQLDLEKANGTLKNYYNAL
ncbi:Outer membrane protein TolC [Filimonas lacunae]|uniref:Outer membrane protein TolC n=1 Tax=Filimonas lacunae TaxID=477680 RepID=A0A173MD97_9BACT|nr:TolC family protein [Filimonas lacunae]BAV05535.1 type I secretion outer membrane protein, TolC precursor [Filimonas lacunae]SIT20510.1 Outer membrane protein TolC [Filimonas lacunae]